jgi:hypothetical protein
MFGVGVFMKRWKKQPMEECPRCGTQETAQHVWVCKGNGASSVWESSLNTLQSWLVSVNTDPDLQHPLISHLQSWRDQVLGPTFTPLHLQQLIDDQMAIGWNRCLEGWLSVHWASAQQRYYNISQKERAEDG